MTTFSGTSTIAVLEPQSVDPQIDAILRASEASLILERDEHESDRAFTQRLKAHAYDTALGTLIDAQENISEMITKVLVEMDREKLYRILPQQFPSLYHYADWKFAETSLTDDYIRQIARGIEWGATELEKLKIRDSNGEIITADRIAENKHRLIKIASIVPKAQTREQKETLARAIVEGTNLDFQTISANIRHSFVTGTRDDDKAPMEKPKAEFEFNGPTTKVYLEFPEEMTDTVRKAIEHIFEIKFKGSRS